METTADEVVDLFSVTATARGYYATWRNNRRRAHVTRYVMSHATSVLYRLDPEAIRAFEVPGYCEHPLGNIEKAAVDSVRAIADWRPDFAFTHVLHYALEATGDMLTYQDFRAFCKEDKQAYKMLTEPSIEAVEQACADGTDRTTAENAMRWRIGNAYYSFLREAYTIAVLRADGLDVRAHPLADALFRVDAWIGRTVLSIYVRNSTYRNDYAGRKAPAEEILENATPPFRFRQLPLDPQPIYGQVHLPDSGRIRMIGRALADAEPWSAAASRGTTASDFDLT